MNDILLIGKPNVGKTLIFNRLTGLQQKVSNFPGVTVELKKGNFENNILIDFPGTYSINAISKDEQVAINQFNNFLIQDSTKLICIVLDATRLELSLVLGLQILKLAATANKPVLFICNMMDELERKKIKLSVGELSDYLQSPVVGISAKKNPNLNELENEIKSIINQDELKNSIILRQKNFIKDLDSNSIINLAKNISQKLNLNLYSLLSNQIKIDQLLLSRLFGSLFFSLSMFLLFQMIFTWAAPFMDLIEESIAKLGELIIPLITNDFLKNFIAEAILGGFGSFLVFVPQIFILTIVIGILEDSGYLARASVLSHRLLSFFGISGKSFVPYLSGFACAIPAIFAARNIESPKKRLLTILTIPLIPCSARLPVYAFLVSFIIPYKTYFYGLINTQGLAFALLYLFGIFSSLFISWILNKIIGDRNSNQHDFILEMPPYRKPNIIPLFRKGFQTSFSFVTKAGPIIFIVTLVIWMLGYFPLGNGQIENSYLGHLGHFLQPIFEPMGLDWKYTICILTSFLAREVFVVTLGTILGIAITGDNNNQVAEVLNHTQLSFAAGISLLVFYAIALQCISTVAIIKQETGKWKYAISTLVGYNVLAYLLAVMIYQILI